MIYKIYSKIDVLKTEFDPGSSSWSWELMSDNVLSLSFTLNTYVDLEVGDYITILGNKFTLKDLSKPKIKSTMDWEYSVKFYGLESMLKYVLVMSMSTGDVDADVSLLDTPTAQLQFLINLVNAFYGTSYTVGAAISVAPQTVDFSRKNVFEALNALADLYSTEWWIDHSTGKFYLTKCISGDMINLGYDQGLLDLYKDDNSSDDSFWTRLYPLGSTKNIIYDDYGHYRLQLPNNVKYIDKDVDLYGIRPKYVETEFADIYPRFTGVVGTVRTVTNTVDDKQITVYYFTDATLNFNPNDYTKSGQVKHLVFKSGDMDGRDFEANWHVDGSEWELITQYPTDDTQLPSGYIIPKAGDTYTIYNMQMPSVYYTNAENEFKAAVDAYVAARDIDFAVYIANTNYVYLDEAGISLTIGSYVRLNNAQYFPSTGYRDSRVTKIVRNLKNLSSMELSISNVLKVGTFSAVQDNLKTLQIAVDQQLDKESLQVLMSYDSAAETDYNVYSSLRTTKEIASRAISKKNDDTVAGTISFMKDIHVTGLVTANEVDANEMKATNGTFANLVKAAACTIIGLATIGQIKATTIDTTLLNASKGTFSDVISTAGIESSKGGLFYGQYSALPNNLGTYVANYTSSQYGARILAYDGVNYQKLSLGKLIGSTFQLNLNADGTSNFGSDLSVTGALIAAGTESSKGGIFYGQYSSFPTGLGSYVANYVSSQYGARILAYNGVSYQDLALGSMPTSGLFSETLRSNGNVDFGYSAGTSDYVSQMKGWRVTRPGEADFRKVYADEMKVQAFTADISQALVGSDYLTKSVTKLSHNFTIPVPATFPMTFPITFTEFVQIVVDDLEGFPDIRCFQDGDYIRFKVFDRTNGLTITDVWGTVKLDTTFGTNGFSNNTQAYIFTIFDFGDAAGLTVFAGSEVLDYGTSGSGVISRTVLDDAGSPYSQVVTWKDDPSKPENYTVHARLGNLDGIANCSGYGLYSNKVFLTESILVGDLTKSGSYLEYSNGNLVYRGNVYITGGNAATTNDVSNAVTSAKGYTDSFISAIPGTIDARIATQVDVNGSIYKAVAASLTLNGNGISLFGKSVNISSADIFSSTVMKNGIISAINQTPETVTISASKIDLRGAVTADSIATGAVTADKIASHAITTDKIATNVLAVGNISGLGHLAGMDNITANLVTDLGTLATLSSVGLTNLDATLISNGKILTSLVVANEVFTNALTAGTIYAGNAVINGLKVTNATVSGTAYITAGDFGDLTISSHNISNDGASDTCLYMTHTGKGITAAIGIDVLAGSTGWSALCRLEDAGSTGYDYKIGANVAIKNATYSNVALQVEASGSTNSSDAVNEHTIGNIAMLIPRGIITGFRLHTRRVTTSQTLSVMDSIILGISNGNDYTLTLPSTSVENGQIILIRKGGTANMWVAGTIQDGWTGNTNSVKIENAQMHIFIYDSVNSRWTHNYWN